MNNLLISLALIVSNGLATEQIVIPVGSQGIIASTPKLGQDKNQVLKLFGLPIKKHRAVGQPPISRWQYQGFVVYFEADTVIHAVLAHQPKNPPQDSSLVTNKP